MFRLAIHKGKETIAYISKRYLNDLLEEVHSTLYDISASHPDDQHSLADVTIEWLEIPVEEFNAIMESYGRWEDLI